MRRLRAILALAVFIVAVTAVGYLNFDKADDNTKGIERAEDKATTAKTRADVAETRADDAATTAKRADAKVAGVEVRTRTIERIVVQKEIARRGPNGLQGGLGPVGETGPRGLMGPLGAPARPATLTELAGALELLCDRRGCTPAEGPPGRDGVDGRDGADAPPPTQEQVNAAIAAYCDTHNNCTAPAVPGPIGPQGPPGPQGEPGTPAPVPPAP